MAMRFCKISFFFLLTIYLNKAIILHAQAPVITPKPGPVVLRLDATGKYAVLLSDIATVSNITNPLTQVSISPANFDCTNLGKQTITITATNGTFSTPTTPSASSFGGPWNITVDGAGNLYFSDFGNNKIKKITPLGGVTTLAGSGNKACNDGQGTSASFSYPIGVVTDNAANVYVADALCNVIKKITPSGTVTTLAGNGIAGFADGNGAAAQFNTPLGLAIDAAGNIYVADSQNERIRKITPAGVVTTVAGDGNRRSFDGAGPNASFGDPSGLVFDKGGNLYVTDAATSRIRKIDISGLVTTIAGSGALAGSSDGPGNAATFNGPYGITIDNAGNLFVADRFNNEIREISTAGIVSTFAGNTAVGPGGGSSDGTGMAASFSDPTGVVIDANGNLFVADRYNEKIGKITPAGVVTTFAGDGKTGDINGNIGGAPATGVQVSMQIQVNIASVPVFGAYPDITINADTLCNARVPDYTVNAKATDVCPTVKLKITQSPAPGTILPFNLPTRVSLTAEDGVGGTTGTSFNLTIGSKPVIIPNQGPIVLTLDAAGKYVAKLADIAKVTSCINSSPAVQLSPAVFDCSALGNQTITVTAFDGSFNTTPDALTATFNHPFGIAYDVAGSLYVTDQLGNSIRKITAQGKVVTLAGNGRPNSVDGTGNTAGFEAPSGIVQDAMGNLYITDNGSGMIRKVTPVGVVTTIAGNNMGFTETDGKGSAASFYNPVGITMDPQGNLYIADQGSGRIRKIDTAYNVTTIAGNLPGFADGKGTAASFYGPAGITIDAQGNLFVCDDYNRRIRKITPQGDVTTVAGSSTPGSFDGTGTSAGFAGITGIVADNNGNLYVTESGTVSKIRKINAQGVVTTIAGTGVSGYADGFAAQAQFNNPTGLVMDGSGNLYIADDGNNRIRKLTPNGIVTTFAGTGSAVDMDGNLDAPIVGNMAQIQIPVTIKGSATVVNTISPTYSIVTGNCTAVLPDYTSLITATDNCTGAAIPFTQSPLPGTALSIGIPVKVTVSTTSTLLNMLSIETIVTASGAQTALPIVTISSSADSICEGNPITFTAGVVNGGSSLSYQWLINGAHAGTNSPTFTAATLNNKDVVNCAVISGAGCTTPVLGNGIVIKVNPSPSVSFNQNPVVSDSSGVKLEPLVSSNIVSYSWTPMTGLDNATIKSPIAKPDNTTVYQLHVISASGCDAVASITVTVVKPLVIPNAFTPNGDGINDSWNIRYLSDYARSTLDIFNRYGQIVFHSVGYGKPWNGTNNGNQLPTGVYYYMIDLKNGTKKISGEVTVIK
jgi:gliding motility-associated-like protein